jgi:hypothetical protein
VSLALIIIDRHPYSRAISFYRYIYDAQHNHPYGYKYHNFVQDKIYPPQDVAQYIIEREDPDKLNDFLQDYIYQIHHPHRPTGIELIPQVQFVYSAGVKYVHHVMHYEFLQRDFSNLMDKYLLKNEIVLPPPDRKRKRKKAIVKKYTEKRRPQPTQTWSSFLLSPIVNFLRYKEVQSPAVDMSLAEIEDEYLLGAQDLADTTLAMLNDHFELDFKKFHYAKIKVNATTDSFWNKVQVIPRESAVAKQQAERNEMLKRQQKGGRDQAAAAPATVKTKEKAKPIARVSTNKELVREVADTKEERENEKVDNGAAAKDGGNEAKGEGGNGESFVDLLKKNAEKQEQREDREEAKDSAASEEGKEQHSGKEE